MNSLSSIFHRKIREQFDAVLAPHIPKNSELWPKSWKTVEFKEYERMPRVKLPRTQLPRVTLENSLEKRESCRDYSNERLITKEELGTLLFWSFGMKAASQKQRGTKSTKTSRFYPSGGALYPLEVYLSITRAEGIEGGIYHYNAKQEELELLLPPKSALSLQSSLQYSWARTSPIVVVITAVWDRNFKKYGDFGYRLVLLETGHAAQNALLTATALELNSCALAGFDDHFVNKMLDIENDNEDVVHMITLGKS